MVKTDKLWYNNRVRGADYSFRRLDFNRLLCKSNNTVSVILIVNPFTVAKDYAASLLQKFEVRTFAPVAA